MAAWPNTLPAPIADGYRLQPVDACAARGMELGTPRLRRLTTDAPTLVDVRWAFTETEFADFEYFHSETIGGGADAFTVALWNGLGSNSYSASFEGAWQAVRLSSGGYLVSATLRIAAREILTAAELEVAEAYALTDIADSASSLHALIHSTLPGTYWVFTP